MNDLKILNELVSIRSDGECESILKYIENKLKEKAEEIIYVKNKEDNKSNIIIGINTKLKDINPVVLSGHIDTVGADEEKYVTNPYNLVIKEGKAYGLGIIDMKCFTSSVIDIIDFLKNYSYPIVLALTTDEETNLYGINSIINKFKELNIKPRFTLIGEPTSFEIKSVSNGCFEYKVEVYGKSCHSSTPQNGVNSICVLAKLVTYIEELCKKYNNLTMSCDLINGGTIINRVPDYATMSFDIRTISMESYNEVLSCVKNKIKQLEEEYKCKIDLNNTLKIPPLTGVNKDNIEMLSQKLGLNVGLFNGGCEAGYYEQYCGEAILFGVGDLSLAHKPNEYMIIEDYEKYNKILVELLDEIKSIYY